MAIPTTVWRDLIECLVSVRHEVPVMIFASAALHAKAAALYYNNPLNSRADIAVAVEFGVNFYSEVTNMRLNSYGDLGQQTALDSSGQSLPSQSVR